MFVRFQNKQSERWRAADSSAMRAHNTSMLLHCLFAEEPISRASLSRRLGLSRSTVSGIVGELLDAGLVEESHVAASRGGRPPIALKVCRDRLHLLGVELGASHVMVVRTNLQGELQETKGAAFPVQHDPEGALRLVERLLGEVADGEQGSAIAGVGLAVPSPLDPARPGLLSERILPAWQGVQPAARLTEALGLPVYMDNDANLGALAESRWGAGAGVSDFAYIKVATGVGAGLIIGGEIYRGAAGIAGEIGHTAIDPDGPQCRCGLSGCLEAMIGSQALAARARARLTAAGRTGIDDAALSLPSLIAAARDGDPLAAGLIEEAGHDLGVAIANLLNLLNPGVVVLGGTLASAGEMLLAPLRAAMRDRSLSTSLESTEVHTSPLGDRVVAIGAAALVLHHALRPPELLFLPGGAPRSSIPQSH